MEVNENLENLGPERVEAQPVPEAAGQAAETEKTYTQSEVDEMVRAKLDEVLPKKIARTKAKIEKDYRRKYGDLESVLKAGTGKDSVEEVTDTFKEFYRNRGIQLPRIPAIRSRTQKSSRKRTRRTLSAQALTRWWRRLTV